jgi:alginate O-acetyltransferase complex protein AlgI
VQFSTAVFATFFVAVYLTHLILRPWRAAWQWFMVAASFVFYSYYEPTLAVVLVTYVAVAHGGALILARCGAPARRRWRAGLIIALIAGLGAAKYATAVTGWIAGLWGREADWTLLTPIGISFLTFQAIGYLVDVSNGKVQPAQRVRETALFLAFFPQLVCGPVLRAKPFLDQIQGPWPLPTLPVGRAAGLIGAAVVKKVVVVGVLTSALEPVRSSPEAFGGIDVAALLVADLVRVWADVSSYADFAVGIGLLLGVRLPANFRQPFAARTFLELWQRWQITVYEFMRDYMFEPLRGKRRVRWRAVAAVLATFTVSGIWHGTGGNYVMFGFLSGCTVMCTAGRRVWYQKRRKVAPRRRGWRAVPAVLNVQLGAAVLMQIFLGRSVAETVGLFTAIVDGWGAAGNVTPLVAIVVAGSVAAHYIPQRWRALFASGLDRLHPVAAAVLLAGVVTAAGAVGPAGMAPYLYYRL